MKALGRRRTSRLADVAALRVSSWPDVPSVGGRRLEASEPSKSMTSTGSSTAAKSATGCSRLRALARARHSLRSVVAKPARDRAAVAQRADILDQFQPDRGDRVRGLGFAQSVGRADPTQHRPQPVDELPPRQFITRGGTPHEFRRVLIGHQLGFLVMPKDRRQLLWQPERRPPTPQLSSGCARHSDALRQMSVEAMSRS